MPGTANKQVIAKHSIGKWHALSQLISDNMINKLVCEAEALQCIMSVYTESIKHSSQFGDNIS